MVKTIITNVAIILFVIIAIVIAGSIYIDYTMANPKIISIPGEIEFEKSKGMWRDYESFPKEEYKINSFDGYEQNVIYVPAEKASNKYVIISHGYSGCRLGSVKYLHLFRELGFNAIMYDDRGHGDNAKAPITMGHNESKDLMNVIDHVYTRFGNDIILGLHGESMGSALSNNSLQYNPNVKFIISDCGYNDLEKLIGYLLNHNLHLPKWLAKTAGVINKPLYGYKYSEIKPIDLVSKTEIPICFFHGIDDDFIPCYHAEEMHKAAVNNYSELNLIPGAGHAECVLVGEEFYKKTVKEFLEKIEIL